MRIVGILLASLIVLGPPRIDARPSPRVVMFGDSLTARGDWPELLERKDVANRGVDGDTIGEATRRLSRVAVLQPRLVVVMLGINDLIGGRAPGACVTDMRRLLDRLRAHLPYGHVVVSSVLPVGPRFSRLTPRIDELNHGLRGLCEDGSCSYLDVAAAFGTDGRGLADDDLHLTAVGYARWAAVLRREVMSTGPMASR